MTDPFDIAETLKEVEKRHHIRISELECPAPQWTSGSKLEDWVIEVQSGRRQTGFNVGWTTFMDAHIRWINGGQKDKYTVPEPNSHSLSYCVGYVKDKVELFRAGMDKGMHYRIHDHISGDSIPLEALI